MSKLPQIKPRPLVKFFLKQGFQVSRQVGSHVRLVHPKGSKITIAIHNKPIAPGTFNYILKQAQMDKETFIKLFKKA
ncbi:MAG: type II toxin-antitoxin system HicA family toxin [Candidatus Blackburnbacteria bacterium]|nr:type II toxin-antitoxin system HicA family toxin [Candidatus Blackburnbacteria bacterium]